jgi:hypothetical protein
MISTGDTAFVLKQHSSRSAAAFRLPSPLSGYPVPGHRTSLVAFHPTLACAMAYSHGLKG